MEWPYDQKLVRRLLYSKFFSQNGTLATNQYIVFSDFIKHFKIRGKDILEVGGGLPYKLVDKAAVKTWLSIDPLNKYLIMDRYTRINGIASSLEVSDNAFDFVFSSNVFEHITNLESSISEMIKVLRPGGYIYAHFGPIWSAPDRHHLENIVYKDEVYNFWNRPLIPPWHHLILSINELNAMLLTKLDRNIVDKLLYAMFKSR